MSFPRTRVRSFGGFAPTYVSGFNVGVINSTSGPSKTSGLDGTVKTMTDTVTPGFRSISSRGGIINNGMTSTIDQRIPCNATVIFTRTKVDASYPQTHTWVGDYLSLAFDVNMPSVNLPDATSTVNTAITKCMANVSSASSMIAVTIAERQKTVNMIADRVGRITRGFLAVKNGNYLLAAEILGVRKKWIQKSRRKQTASNWLEWRYGWLPLYLDARGAVQALKKVNEPRFTARGFSAMQDHTSSLQSVNFLNGGACQPWGMRTVRFSNTSVRAYCLYTVDDNFLTASAFGLTDPVSVAWELIPFSFVVDWFVDVGTWLEAIKPTPGVRFLAKGYTIESIGQCSYTIESVANSLNQYSHAGLLGLTNIRYVNSKTRYADFAVPFHPSFGSGLNLTRATDSIALLMQLFSKRK